MATISAQIAALATSASPTTTTPSALSRVLGPAYLQGELEDGETVYCLPPPGYENERIGSDGRPMIATR